jgi:hypothetical protein
MLDWPWVAATAGGRRQSGGRWLFFQRGVQAGIGFESRSPSRRNVRASGRTASLAAGDAER